MSTGSPIAFILKRKFSIAVAATDELWLISVAPVITIDAIQGYLESLNKDGEPIPKDELTGEQLATI